MAAFRGRNFGRGRVALAFCAAGSLAFEIDAGSFAGSFAGAFESGVASGVAGVACLGGGRVSWTCGRASGGAIGVSGMLSLLTLRVVDVGNEYE